MSKDLDRETIDNHQIRVIATNLESYPQTRVSDNSALIVNIVVNDVNDNPPSFQYEEYSVGVSEKDQLEKVLLTLVATDPDLDDIISYYILTDTISVTGEGLDDVKETAFLVNQLTGALTLNFQLQSSMKGYFEFDVQARDLVNHTDEASVKIFLVAAANLVAFQFANDVESVRKVNLNILAKVFSDAYESECIIDDILPTEIDGVAQTNSTDIRMHFVSNNQAVEADEIKA